MGGKNKASKYHVIIDWNNKEAQKGFTSGKFITFRIGNILTNKQITSCTEFEGKK